MIFSTLISTLPRFFGQIKKLKMWDFFSVSISWPDCLIRVWVVFRWNMEGWDFETFHSTFSFFVSFQNVSFLISLTVNICLVKMFSIKFTNILSLKTWEIFQFNIKSLLYKLHLCLKNKYIHHKSNKLWMLY